MSFNGVGRVLIVDDDDDARRLLVYACETADYAVREAASGEEAFRKLEAEPFDVMLLDLRLPDMDGVDVLDEIASTYPDLITIILTANPTQDSAIAAIRMGAADYLTKPAKIKDVLVTIAANLAQRALRHRRLIQLGTVGKEIVGYDERDSAVEPDREVGKEKVRLQLDPQARIATLSGKNARRVALTKSETAILEVFLQKAGNVLSYQDLVYGAWGERLEIDHAASIIRPLIFRLRRKLEVNPSTPRLIRTVRGSGYVFDPR